MTYKDNQPTFNINRKVVNFKDFNRDAEEAELKKIKRQNKPNSETQQLIANPRIKYNKVTHKLDFDNNPDILKDKIESIGESKINDDLYKSIKNSISYAKFVETLKIALNEFKEGIKSDDSVSFDVGDTDHNRTFELALRVAIKEADQ